MSKTKISLVNIPKSADRDTTVFFKSLKQAIDALASNQSTVELTAKSMQYVQQLNKRTYQEIEAQVNDSLGIGKLLDLLNGSITSTQLHKDLSQRIDKITSNENAISAERLQRIADLLAANQAIIDERRDRVQEITVSANALQDKIEAEALARLEAVNQAAANLVNERNERVADVIAANTAIGVEAKARADAIIAANNAIVAETQDRLDALLNANNAISAERDARIGDILVVSNAIAIEAQGRASGILEANNAIEVERLARIEDLKGKAKTLQDSIDAEGAERLRLDNLLAQNIINETTQRQSDTEILTEQFNGVYAQVNPRMSGDINRWAGDDSYFAGAWSLQSARIEDKLVTAKSIEVVTSNINSNKAAITQVNETLVTKNEVVANQINTLAAQMTGGYKGNDLLQVTSGLIYQERTARATEFEGLAEQISLLSAGVGEQFDPFQIWHFNEDKDGWIGGSYNNGFIDIKNESLQSPAFEINGNMYRHIKLRIKKVGTPTWAAKVTHSSIDQTINEPDFDSDGIATISIRMQWNGMVTGFSLKLSATATVANYYSIDWIAVGRPSPGASSAALLNEQRVRSSTDEALAQSISALDSRLTTETGSLSSSINQSVQTLTTASQTNATNISTLNSRVETDVGTLAANISSNYETLAIKTTANATKIDSAITKTGENTAAILAESTVRTDADSALSTRVDTVLAVTGINSAAIQTESTTRTDANSAMSTRIDTLSTATGANSAAIAIESTARSDADGALGSRVDTIVVKTDENSAAIQTESTARTDADSALSTRVDTVLSKAGDNAVAITSESTARTDADTALGTRIDTVSSKTANNTATITSNFETLTTKTTATATKIDGVFAQVNPQLAGATDTWAGDNTTKVGVWSEQSARIENDLAIGQRIDTLTTSIDNSNALIRSDLKVVVDKESALASRADLILAKTETNAASINTESTARADADEAISEQVTSVLAVTGTNAALINSEIKARTDADGALSTRIDTLTASTGANTAAIQLEQGARTDADEATAFQIENLSAITGTNAAAIQTESTARTDADTALSGRIDTVLAKTGDNTASIIAEVKTRADADSALSSRVDTVVSTTGANAALIASESTARTNADSALSIRIDTVSATTEGNTATIYDNFQTLTGKTSANASRIDGVFAQVNPKMAGDVNSWAGDDSKLNIVGVWTERSAIIENEVATSKRIDGLTSKVDDNKASITQVNTTLVNKTEVVANQINMLSAQMTGGYGGSNLNDVSSGLIYQERKARATDIKGLAEQMSLLSAGVGEQFDSFEIWHFNKNSEGWVNGVYADGWINVRTETVNSPAITVDGNVYKHVKLRIQKVGTPTWDGKLTYSETSLNVPEPQYNEEGFAIVNFYPEWSGIITSLSLKLASLANNLNYFKIDWIAVGRPAPGASSAALLREEKARADKDMSLTQSITSLDTQINGDGVNASSSIVQKLETVTTKSSTNATNISNLSSSFNNEVLGSEGVVARNAKTAASAASANANDISGVFAQVNPRMAGDTSRWAGEDDPLHGVGVWTERSAIIENGIASAEKFEAMTARVDKNKVDISTETKIRVDAIKALAQQTETIRADFEGSAGVLQTKITAQADATTALSNRTDTIQSTVGENTASVQAVQSSVNGINAKWSLRTDVNGVIGGLGIDNDGRMVDFIVSSSRFALMGTSGSKSTPFVQTTEVTYINGQRVPIGSYMDAAFIMNGSMTNAKIGNAAVDTLQIKGNAVIVPRVQYTATAQEIPFSILGEDVMINELSINAEGGAIAIQFGFERLSSSAGRNEPQGSLAIKLYRGSELLRTMEFTSTSYISDWRYVEPPNNNKPYFNPIYTFLFNYSYNSIPTFFDTPPLGEHTYRVAVSKLSGNLKSATITARSLFLLGAKR